MLEYFQLNFGGMLEYLHETLVVCGVFQLNFGGMMEYFH